MKVDECKSAVFVNRVIRGRRGTYGPSIPLSTSSTLSPASSHSLIFLVSLSPVPILSPSNTCSDFHYTPLQQDEGVD
jgi:hypothetical protein